MIPRSVWLKQDIGTPLDEAMREASDAFQRYQEAVEALRRLPQGSECYAKLAGVCLDQAEVVLKELNRALERVEALGGRSRR